MPPTWDYVKLLATTLKLVILPHFLRLLYLLCSFYYALFSCVFLELSSSWLFSFWRPTWDWMFERKSSLLFLLLYVYLVTGRRNGLTCHIFEYFSNYMLLIYISILAPNMGPDHVPRAERWSLSFFLALILQLSNSLFFHFGAQHNTNNRNEYVGILFLHLLFFIFSSNIISQNLDTLIHYDFFLKVDSQWILKLF